MPPVIDIQKATERVKNGTDVISNILRMKKEARQAIINGSTEQLGEAGFKVVPFNAPAV
ncbi:hypothetical protein [Hymenobacter fodinae]|uniref:hypothetical protein n=1 Tax=Hymenobacter fodinae TaxID=2510796 RepID=UPI001436991C|nr:hypothetical protein [Hymenobacter fodinae]